MKFGIVVLSIIGCAMATPPVVTTLVSDFGQNTFRLHNGPPFGGSISAELPSIGTILPLLTELAPLALSLGELGTLGARLLPALPNLQLGSLPLPLQFPFPIPSITPVSYSGRSLIPYPYSIYAGARFR